MSSILDEIREMYLSKYPKETNPEAIQAMDILLDAEKALIDTLTEEQKKLFLSYSNAVSDFHEILETDTFRHGVRCAVQFLTEAMRTNG